MTINRLHRFRWTIVLVALVLVFVIGSLAGRSGDTATRAERIDALASQIRCPTCAGLSVQQSDSPLAVSAEREIAAEVDAGRSDQEIKQYFVSRYGDSALITPERDGIAATAWLLPGAVVLTLLAGVAYATVRWRRAGSDGASFEYVPPAIPDATVRTANTTPVDKRLYWAAGVGAFVLLVAVALSTGISDRLTGDNSTGDIAADTNSLLLRAGEQTSTGRVTEAVKTYDQVLQRDPANTRALTYRGWLVRLAGLSNEGMASIERAIAIDPAYPDARLYKGIILLRDRSDAAGAVKEFETFLASNPPEEMVPLVQQSLDDARAQARR